MIAEIIAKTGTIGTRSNPAGFSNNYLLKMQVERATKSNSRQLTDDKITAAITRDAENIRLAQLLILKRDLYAVAETNNGRKTGKFGLKSGNRTNSRRTGALEKMLSAKQYTVATAAGSWFLNFPIKTPLRFLDMKHRANLHVYNAQVWGVLYHNSYRDIRYGMADVLRDELGEMLRNALQQE